MTAIYSDIRVITSNTAEKNIIAPDNTNEITVLNIEDIQDKLNMFLNA